jgi:hypothetical protein
MMTIILLSIAPLKVIRDYLKLHWLLGLLVAFKQKQYIRAFFLAFPAVFSPVAWKLLARAILRKIMNYGL